MFVNASKNSHYWFSISISVRVTAFVISLKISEYFIHEILILYWLKYIKSVQVNLTPNDVFSYLINNIEDKYDFNFTLELELWEKSISQKHPNII